MKYLRIGFVLAGLLFGVLFFGGCGTDTGGQVVPDQGLNDIPAVTETGQPQVLSGALWDWWSWWYRNRNTGSGNTGGSTGGDTGGNTGGGDTGGGTTPPPTDPDCAATVDAYGKNGQYSMTSQTFSNPMWSGGAPVTVFLPNRTDPAPVMFFSHGYGGAYGAQTSYKSLITYLVSRGMIVVYSPYPNQLTPVQRNLDIMFNGFELAAEKYATRMDLTKVGFLGHSYGGGAVPSMARRGLAKGWGSQGAFMSPLAAWYVYDMTDAQFASFPANVKMIVQAYNADTMNDHRMGIDIFNSTTSIPSSEKAYYNVVTGALPADHYVPTDQRVNQLDTDVVRKSLGALIDYTFNTAACGTQAKAWALDGTGAHFQSTVTKSPAPVSSSYLQRWSSSMNPRR